MQVITPRKKRHMHELEYIFLNKKFIFKWVLNINCHEVLYDILLHNKGICYFYIDFEN